MQLRLQTHLTGEQYVSQQLWRDAMLTRCPLHPYGGCGFARHGTYERVSPPGTRIARWYCRKGRCTFSLLPDCLAARLSGTLEEVEAVVETVEKAPRLAAAANELRLDIELPGALRWRRRRVQAVHRSLHLIKGLLPEPFAACLPTLLAFRQLLAVACVLVTVREIAAAHLPALPPPLGLRLPPYRGGEPKTPYQQRAGPDPPAAWV